MSLKKMEQYFINYIYLFKNISNNERDFNQIDNVKHLLVLGCKIR